MGFSRQEYWSGVPLLSPLQARVPRKVAAFNTEIQDATVMVSRDAVPHCAIWSMNGTALRELGPILANAVWYPDEVATP